MPAGTHRAWCLWCHPERLSEHTWESYGDEHFQGPAAELWGRKAPSGACVWTQLRTRSETHVHHELALSNGTGVVPLGVMEVLRVDWFLW